MNVFKNYKVKKDGNVEEFPAVEVRYNDTEVFTELPVCIVPYENELKEPMLFKQDRGIGIVMEKQKLLNILSKQRIFHLIKNDKGELKEVEANKATYHVRLPKDTDVKELGIINNQLVKIEKNQKPDPATEPPKTPKYTGKSQTKKE